jgi:predicted nucleic acid-binding protein
MKIVIDANVLFAVLIKEGTTAASLFDKRIIPHTPRLIWQEFLAHRHSIISKTHRTLQEMEEYLALLRQRIIVDPDETLLPFLQTAYAISPDPDDAPYVALALALSIPLWSNDTALKRVPGITVLTTANIHALLRTPENTERDK